MGINGNINEKHMTSFLTSNLKVLHIIGVVTSEIQNDTFQYFAHLPLQVLTLFVAENTDSIQKGVFTPLSNVTKVMISNEVLPTLASLSSPLREFSLFSSGNSLKATKKKTHFKFFRSLTQHLLTLPFKSNHG